MESKGGGLIGSDKMEAEGKIHPPVKEKCKRERERERERDYVHMYITKFMKITLVIHVYVPICKVL